MADDPVRITRSVAIPATELDFRFSRAGGPGGQHANRRETKVELVFDVADSPSLGPRQRARVFERLGSRIDDDGCLHVVASDERSQTRNRELAIGRFRDLLAEALRPPKPRKPTRRTKGADERRLEGKKRRGRKKRDRSWRPPGEDL